MINVIKRVVHTVVVNDCVTRTQVIVQMDVKVVTMEISVTKVSSDFFNIIGDFFKNENKKFAVVCMILETLYSDIISRH